MCCQEVLFDVNTHLYNASGPAAVTVSPQSTTSATVTVTPAVDSSGVVSYAVQSGSASCDIVAGSSPLSCELSGLEPGSQHRVEAVACLVSGMCSFPTTGTGYTLPEGN